MECSDDAIVGKTLEGRITSWNPAAERMYGYTAEEVLGRHVSFLTPSGADDDVAAMRARVARRERVDHFEAARRRKDGTDIRVSLSVSPIADERGTIVGVSTIARDVTERSRMEERFRGLLESAPDATVIVDEHNRVVLVNAQAEKLFGHSRAELLEMAVEELIPGRYRERHVEHRMSFFHEPRTRPMGAGLELYALHKSGREIPVEVSLSPLETTEGTLVSAAVRDITDRKTAERMFRGLLESAPDAMVIVGSDGKIELINAQTQQLFGYEREELLGQPVEILIPPRYTDRHARHRAGFFSAPSARPMGAQLELYATDKSGREFPVEISLSPMETEQGILVSAAVRDITDRKLAEQDRLRLAQVETERALAETAAQRMGRLQQIADVAFAHSDLDPLLSALVAQVADLLPGAGVAVLLKLDGERLELKASAGPARAAIERQAGSSAGRVIARGATVVEPAPGLGPAGELAGVALFVAGEVIGALVVGRVESGFHDDDLQLLALIGDRASLAIHRARLYEREHETARTLQRSLLPERLPDVPGLDLAARYLPGAAGTEVGGDWYDVFLLPDSRLGLAMGDVVGHGIPAAALVGKLRNGLRAYALDGYSTAAVVARLNSLIYDSSETAMATLVYLTYDAASGEVELVSAGHPAPLVRRASGETEYLEGGRSVPVGAVEHARYAAAVASLGAGDTLLLYTDGLIERRGANLGDGMSALASAAQSNGSADRLCTQVLAQLINDQPPADDVALLVLHLPASPP